MLTKIILDTNIIIKYPKVLGLTVHNVRFLIPTDVIEELNVRANNRGASSDSRVRLIERASLEGSVSIINTYDPIYIARKNLVNVSGLSGADLGILSIAVELKDKGEAVKIATLDKDILRQASLYDIGVLSEGEIDTLVFAFDKSRVPEKTIQKAINNYENSERRSLLLGILIGSLAAIISTLIYNNLGIIISTLNIWATVVSTLLFGILLFIAREKQRLSYGIFEFVIGVITIVVFFQSNNFDYSRIDFDADSGIKILGGLYIMVRGQDNIVKALKDTKFGVLLKEKYDIGS